MQYKINQNNIKYIIIFNINNYNVVEACKSQLIEEFYNKILLCTIHRIKEGKFQLIDSLLENLNRGFIKFIFYIERKLKNSRFLKIFERKLY